MHHLLAKILRAGRKLTAAHAARHKTAAGRTVGLRVESLEDRTVPSGTPVANLVVIGDSLSDVGNLKIATGSLPNSNYYANGQGRFSSGPIWVDTLAEYLGAP